MKTIGLLGGMSWESTVTYYQIINRLVQERLGGLHSAKCLLYSVDFAEIEACQSAGQWEKSGELLAEGARRLERGGADFFLICTNTMHKVAPQVRAAVGIPLLHLAEVAADELQRRGMTRAALLGTRYTMEEDFYAGVLRDRGIEVMTPAAPQRAMINDIIFNELCLGRLREDSRRNMAEVARDLGAAGAQGVVLGCTEIGLLLRQQDSPVPLLDTTVLHATAAAELAMR